MSYSGWLQCQRHGLQDDVAAQAGRHQGQQTWHEPHALRCQGEEKSWDGQLLSEEKYLQNCDATMLCHADSLFHPQQAEDIDTELLTFPTQLEHIGEAARWLYLFIILYTNTVFGSSTEHVLLFNDKFKCLCIFIQQ